MDGTLFGGRVSGKRSIPLFRLSLVRRKDTGQPLIRRATGNKSDKPMLRKQNIKNTWMAALVISLVTHPAAAQFTTEQDVAFGLNTGRLAADLNDLIAAAIFAAILLAFGFMSYAAYGRWTTGQMSASSMSLLLVRASLLLVIAGLFLR